MKMETKSVYIYKCLHFVVDIFIILFFIELPIKAKAEKVWGNF